MGISELDTSPHVLPERELEELTSVPSADVHTNDTARVTPATISVNTDASSIRLPGHSFAGSVSRKAAPVGLSRDTPHPIDPENTFNQSSQVQKTETTALNSSPPIPSANKEPASPTSLQGEIDRIREERERLSRLIELGRMEERLRQQMAEQKMMRAIE